MILSQRASRPSILSATNRIAPECDYIFIFCRRQRPVSKIPRVCESQRMQLAHAIFEPAGDGQHPTILALHGWGANAQDLLGLAPYLGGGRFLVICPQGPLEVPLGPQGPVGYGWFPLTLGQPPDVPAILSARDNLRSFLDAALK